LLQRATILVIIFPVRVALSLRPLETGGAVGHPTQGRHE
jgi:hypothetical protein